MTDVTRTVVVPQPTNTPAPIRPTLLRGAQVQGVVIGALIMRELHTRYGRENVGYVWLILEPLMLASMIAVIHAQAPSHFGSDVKPVPLSVIGYCVFIMFRGIVNRSEGAIEANAPLLYHRNVTVFDILLSRALLEAAGTILSLVVLMGLIIALGMANLPERPLFMLIGIACMFVLSLGFSMIVCSATYHNHAVGRFVHPISYILMPLSGAFYSMSWLPSGARNAFGWLPFVHIFETVRYGQFKSARLDYVNPTYLAAWLLGSIVIGLLWLSHVRSRIQL